MTQALELETNKTNNFYYTALFNRAVACLGKGDLDAAKKDYTTLQHAAPAAFQFSYGLGEIAYRQKDTNEAIRNFELYLQNAPPTVAEANSVRRRLADLYEGDLSSGANKSSAARSGARLKELYELLLASAATNSPEANTISNRLAQLRRGTQ